MRLSTFRALFRLLLAGALVVGACLVSGLASAGRADVVSADATCRPAPGGRPASVCSFSATVRHADAGWDHYANRWDVVAPDGDVIASRVLRHPHVDEQPFRRSLGRVRIPHATKSVTVRANDSVHGTGGAEVTVDVPHASGAGAAPGADADEGAAPPPVE